MKKNRLIASLLCLLLACSLALAACGSETTTDESSNTSAETSKDNSTVDIYRTEDGTYTLDKLNMPTFEFTETEFRVCVYNNVKQATYYSEEIGYDMYSTTDTAINEAVRTRNDLVEEKYNVRVVAYAVDDVKATLDEFAMVADCPFDAAMPFMPACAALAQQDMLYDLKSYDSLHLEAPWWDQSANNSLSINNKLYFTIGDISIMQKITSYAITFNKAMYSQLCRDTYGDLYQMVRDHQWTFDRLHEMGKLATADIDGESGLTYKDQFGLSSSNNDAVLLYLASGQRLISKGTDDLPMLSFGENELSKDVAIKILDTMQQTDWTMNCQKLTGVSNVWQISLDVFGENRALFRTTAFSAIKKLRNYTNGDDFGIVPIPLMYEGQDTYYTPSSARFAYGVCIPKSVSNPEFSAYMLEVLSCYAKNTITPAYYDSTLKGRDAKDPESEEMLDRYIFNNVVYDLGIIYDFGNVASMFGTLMEQNSTAIVSTLDANRSAIETAIKDCIDDFNLNG